MNFKLLQFIKLATLATVLVSFSLFAQVPIYFPIYLHIQNNTAYNFDIKQAGGSFGNTVEAYKSKEFAQLPWSFVSEENLDAQFILSNNGTSIIMGVAVYPNQINATTYMEIQLKGYAKPILSEWKTITPDPSNEYNLFITLAGTENNVFDGSSIKLEVKKGKIIQEISAKIMGAISYLAPALYQEMIAVDPTGANHILQDDRSGATNILVFPSYVDGLPLFSVGSRAIQMPQEELWFVIAHELGHYVLGHFEKPKLVHEVLKKVPPEQFKPEAFKEGKKIGGQLAFEKAFELASNRQKENEADRFAVMELGIPIKDALAWINEKIVEYEEHKLKTPEKITFTLTHPLFMTRKKQFEDLVHELEVYKRKPMQINWKQLVNNYKVKI